MLLSAAHRKDIAMNVSAGFVGYQNLGIGATITADYYLSPNQALSFKYTNVTNLLFSSATSYALH